MWILLTVGLLSILGQVVLLRELSVASYGIELVYLLALGVWLLAGAVGAVTGGWVRKLPIFAVAALLAVFGVALPASVVFVRASRLMFAAVPGAYLPFPQQMMVIVFALAPVSLLLGVLFQWAARLYIGEGRSLAMAYGVESAGGVIGGLAATLLSKGNVQNFALAIGCGFVALLAAFSQAKWRGSRLAQCVFAALIAAGVALLSTSGSLDRAMTMWSHQGLVDTRDSPYGRVTVARAEGQLSVFENDALWFDTESIAAETFTHLVLLQHPNPRRVLLLGGGVEGLTGHALQHAPDEVDYVELNEQMYRMVGPYLPTVMRSLAAPNVRIIFTDPRRFLQKSGRYDVILVAMPEPTSGAANRFYTKEFFSTCAGRLNPGGVVGFRLQSSENYWPPLLSRRMVSIDRAARSAFPYLIVLPGTTNVFLASSGPLPSDAAVLEDRLNARPIHATLVSGPFLRYLYTNDRRAEIARTLKGGGGPENTDGRPICYQYAAVMWLSKFFPAMAATELPTMSAVSGGGAAWILWICILAMFGLSRISGMWRRALLVGVAGFAGMVLETVLILHFQMKNGIIFQDIGMLLTGFMAGLAAGSVGFTLLARSRDGSGRAFRWSGAAILGGLVSLGLLVERAADTGAMGGLVSVSVLLGAAGVLVAALFAYASLHRNSDQSRLVSPLYAADLLGGCAGSLLASLLLIPMAGLALSARYVAVLAVLALVLL